MIEIPQDAYDMLEREITSDDSPVGIDAKKTHILILHKLIQIEKRLDRLDRVCRANRKTSKIPDSLNNQIWTMHCRL